MIFHRFSSAPQKNFFLGIFLNLFKFRDDWLSLGFFWKVWWETKFGDKFLMKLSRAVRLTNFTPIKVMVGGDFSFLRVRESLNIQNYFLEYFREVSPKLWFKNGSKLVWLLKNSNLIEKFRLRTLWNLWKIQI